MLFFSLHDERWPWLRQALDAGARNCVTKQAAPTVLLGGDTGSNSPASLTLEQLAHSPQPASRGKADVGIARS